MSTFRALCAELLRPLAEYDGANPYHEHRDLITRARAELANSEPAGPTRDELRAMAAEFAVRTPEEFALAVLARWGRPAQPEPVGPINYEGLPCDLTRTLLRPGYEPGDGSAEGFQVVNQAWWHPVMGRHSLQTVVDNARAVIARLSRPTTQPTPVSERPWERKGWCDAQGRCWVGEPESGDFDVLPPEWKLVDPTIFASSARPIFLLPHWALPLPTTATETP
jgi:hypothetical protein